MGATWAAPTRPSSRPPTPRLPLPSRPSVDDQVHQRLFHHAHVHVQGQGRFPEVETKRTRPNKLPIKAPNSPMRALASHSADWGAAREKVSKR
jgi:hypothetical protein